MDTIPENSVVNIHLKDGSSTGGREYVGVHAPVPYDGSAGPEIVLRPIDGGEAESVSFDDIDWVDVLASPFSRHDFTKSPDLSHRELNFVELCLDLCLDVHLEEFDDRTREVGKAAHAKVSEAIKT